MDTIAVTPIGTAPVGQFSSTCFSVRDQISFFKYYVATKLTRIIFDNRYKTDVLVIFQIFE